jgi:hypothetical protein
MICGFLGKIQRFLEKAEKTGQKTISNKASPGLTDYELLKYDAKNSEFPRQISWWSCFCVISLILGVLDNEICPLNYLGLYLFKFFLYFSFPYWVRIIFRALFLLGLRIDFLYK